MDMSKYAGAAFIGLDDVRDAPLRGTIEGVEIEQKYDRPILTFSNGLRFSLNVTNVQAMLKVLGSESDDWLGETIELSAGKAKFKDELVDSVVLRVVAHHPETEKPKVKPPRPKSKDGNGGHGDLDDQIPW
jgi:hypothetical protein